MAIKYLKYFFLLGVCTFSFTLNAQDTLKKYEFGGYISNMQSIQFQDIQGDWINDNLIHNRLNFDWFPGENLSFKLGLRNRFFTGESLKLIPDYGSFITASELGYLDLSWNVIEEKSVIMNMNIDRLYFQYEKGDFSATIGRQRINWGKTFAWNPNDLFNAYSFFDFDYVEKPGSDAVRLQYYTSYVSSVELAAKIDKDEDITLAALWRFNKWNYDFQLLAGMLNSSEYAIGGGWSGAIKSLDFKGEFSYLHPKDNMSDTTGQFIGSVSAGYTFANSLSLTFEFLYTDIVGNGISDFYQYYYQPLSVKTLSFTEYNLFGQASYQITPLLSGTFACMYYPKINGYFLGPSFDYSFTDNLFASLVIQNFSGDMVDPITGDKNRNYATYAFLRLKWSF
ncbi:MAG: hypothetical protein P1P88_10650 [Bacteroidales bacterium]|nr:hypothetical protein [Bacteroidales bacterium]